MNETTRGAPDVGGSPDAPAAPGDARPMSCPTWATSYPLCRAMRHRTRELLDSSLPRTDIADQSPDMRRVVVRFDAKTVAKIDALRGQWPKVTRAALVRAFCLFRIGHDRRDGRGRPVKHTSIRMDEETLARVEALRPRYSQPWRKATRTDILLILILQGLGVKERGETASCEVVRSSGAREVTREQAPHALKAAAVTARR